jgi:glucose-6-phosphate 1-dehydrogenase
MMKYKTLLAILIALCSILVLACRHQGRELNESLRLPQTQIETYKNKATAGDADAAKKLWHHYSYVEMDVTEGERWKKLYDELQERRGTTSPTQSSDSH